MLYMKKYAALLLLFVALPLSAGVSGDLRKGDKLYNQKKYGQALSAYERALEQDPGNAKAAFGAGAAAYYLKDYPAAENAFSSVVSADENLAQDALFNLGTSFYRAGDKAKAKEIYRQALLKNPDDKETLHNYQIILEEEQKSDNQNQDQNQENKNDNDQQNSDQNQNDPNQGQGKGQDENQNQNPEQNDTQDNMRQDDAQRVMQMARDNERKPQQEGRSQHAFGADNVEKDW